MFEFESDVSVLMSGNKLNVFKKDDQWENQKHTYF